MPKVKRDRSKLHSAAVGWQQAGSGKASKSKGGDIEVLDEDVAGLDVESAAHESEDSKRRAVANALKDLIAMGSDDEDDDDEEDDEEDEAAMQAVLDGMGSDSGSDDDMDGRMPAKGSLQVKPRSALKAAGSKAAAGETGAAAKPALSFAPSAPSRSAADIVAAARAAIAAKAVTAPAAAAVAAGADGAAAAPAKVKASKLDKRAARHERLMTRLALPGTAAVTAKRTAKGISAGAFHSLNLLGAELSTSVLTPTQQNAIAKLKAMSAGGGSEKRDVLFLSEEGDRERMKQLQAQIQRVKQQTVVAAPRPAQSAAPAANSAAAAIAAAAPGEAAPAAAAAPTPSPFIPAKNLSKQGRKRQHAAELAHFAAVLHHPSFQSAPLSALHTHLTNTAALQKLQHEAAGLQAPAAPAHPKKSMSGSAKKKNKKAQDRRQQILQQANQ